MSTKVNVKIEQIARMRVGGVSDKQVCNFLRISQGGLSRIVALQEYKDVEATILQGFVTKTDEVLAGRVDQMRAHFSTAVPAAMQTLVEAVKQRRDLRAAIAASKEILDRDPQKTFAVQKAGVEQGAQTNLPASVMASLAADGAKIASSISRNGPTVIAPADTKTVN